MRQLNSIKTIASLAMLSIFSATLAGCSLPIRAPEQQNVFRFNSPNIQTPTIDSTSSESAFLIQMRTPRAAEGFNTQSMMYSRDALNLAPYRDSRWLATPAHMLGDVIEQTLLKQPWVAGVVPNSANAPVAANLSCRLIRLEHDIDGSTGKAHLVMSCLWTTPANHEVQAHWRFDQTQAITRNDATGFATASQQLVDQAVTQIIKQTRAVIVKSAKANS